MQIENGLVNLKTGEMSLEQEDVLVNVLEAIDHLDKKELEELQIALKDKKLKTTKTEPFDKRIHRGSFLSREKTRIAFKAARRYTLEELENRLGNSFEIM